MKKPIRTTLITLSLSLFFTIPALAGWEMEGTSWKYKNETIYITDEFREIEGVTYHFSETGIMDTGWKLILDSWYYFASDGRMYIGEQIIEGKAYTFDHSGRLLHEGIFREGMENDLLSEAFVLTHKNWSDAQYMLSLVNQARSEVGASPLSLDFNLSVIATYRCAHMDRYNYMGHVYNNEYPCDTNWNSYTGNSNLLGEIIYCLGNPADPNTGYINRESHQDVALLSYKWFLTSSGHYASMINPNYRLAGVGFYQSQSKRRDFTTTLFSR